MRARSWIALTLCTAALAWSCASRTWAEEPSREPQADATPAAEGAKDAEGFDVVDEPPKVVKQVPPKYPPAALKRGTEGTVFVRALVKKDGVPSRVVVPPGKGVSPELDKAAVDAVSQWRFTPARLKGKPVATFIVIPVKFRLH